MTRTASNLRSGSTRDGLVQQSDDAATGEGHAVSGGPMTSGPWQDDTTGHPLLTVIQVAAMLNVSRSKVYQMIARGDVPSFMIGGSRRFHPVAIQRWLADRMRDLDVLVLTSSPSTVARKGR